MQIKNRKTGVTLTVKKETWDKLKQRGETGKYEIVSKSDRTETPDESKRADYATIVKDAAAAMDGKDFETAGNLYRKAYAIKETKFVKEKLDELDKLATPKS